MLGTGGQTELAEVRNERDCEHASESRGSLDVGCYAEDDLEAVALAAKRVLARVQGEQPAMDQTRMWRGSCRATGEAPRSD